MNRLKKGDQVYIISGKDKGKWGVVSQIVGEELNLVDGINLAKKHVKPNPNKNETGGVIEKEMSIHTSTAMIYNSKTKKTDRVGILKLKDDTKIRVFKSTGEQNDIWAVDEKKSIKRQ